jgi:hypothetical protein
MYKEMGIDYAKRGNAKKVSLNNGEVLDYRETVEGEKILLLVHGNMISSKKRKQVLCQ